MGLCFMWNLLHVTLMFTTLYNSFYKENEESFELSVDSQGQPDQLSQSAAVSDKVCGDLWFRMKSG